MDFSAKKTKAALSHVKENGTLAIIISGELTAHSLPYLWQKALKLQKNIAPNTLIIEAKNLTLSDSIGTVLLLEIKKRQLQSGKKFLLQNPSAELQKLFTLLDKKRPPTLLAKPERLNFIAKIGKTVFEALEDIKENISFLGELTISVLQFLANPKHIRWQDFWRSLEDIGPKALPIILLIGFLVGVIITFQSAAPFAKFGAQIYIVDLVGLGLVREMGPLMTAIILSGRTASAFAAEIGSMKINQEIDALITMGINPVKFLSIPRILAATLMTPLLSLFLMAAGVVGCFLTMVSLGNNFHMISNELYQIVTVQDFIAGLLKTFVFGAIITSIGCLHGIKTSMGASAVGTSTTKAVVSSLIMLTVADGIFAVVYYALGI